MNRFGLPRLLRLVLVGALLLTIGPVPGPAAAQSVTNPSEGQALSDGAARIAKYNEAMEQSYITQSQREAAAARLKVMQQAAAISAAADGDVAAAAMTAVPGGVPDYFGTTPNWAYSPLLRKFVDTLPGVGPAGQNNLGNFISVAHPDTVTYPGSDYYEIELREYEQQLHSDMPPTRLRGYVQTNYGTDPTATNPTVDDNTVAPDPIMYLGPIIQATKDRPVRVKFTNKLPVGEGGDLFIPVDTTVMGAGMGPIEMPMPPGDPVMYEMYTENRATLHLHGGITPWISDGTPHQWITPAGEDTVYPEGVSVQNVPDMPDPGDGSMTFFYTNEQSARLLWYHDHSYGITRLNVYVGEAAPYELTDNVEQQLIADGIIPGPEDTIPLIVQDKTFVDATTIGTTDPTWNWGSTPPYPKTGDLWMPHVYVPAQNPADPGGMNPTGRWHYGPWFWPPTSDITYPPITNPYYVDPVTTPWENPTMPATPNPSMGMEAFHDTPLVNGTAYPVLEVDPKTYRFRILNAASDRFFNLQLYKADPSVITADGRTNTEVKMVPAVPTPEYELLYPDIVWPVDGRDGGAPDPATAGPAWLQIGTESGFMPTPADIPQQPITWNGDPTTFNMGNVQDHSLLVAPAERADVIMDFSAYAGQTLILYNDAPTAFPALDARTDYYTGAPDMTDTGGTKTPQAGYGPNTRTIMQIKVKAAPPDLPYDRAALDAAFTTTPGQDSVFKRGQNPIIVPDARYNSAYNLNFVTDPYVRIYENLTKTFQVYDGTTLSDVALPIEPKAIQDEMGETFDTEYGRMSSKFGLQIAGVGGNLQNFMLYDYADPSTENLKDQLTPLSPILPDGTQFWRFTHNGVDTHPVHFHLFDVQLINRVGWDGAIRPPDANELGWKDTVRVSPLEDTIIALKPVSPKVPFGMPESYRPYDPTMPIGAPITFQALGPGNVPETVTIPNAEANFNWEYVFHCHILSHEEMDMMRPVTFEVAHDFSDTPSGFGASGEPGGPITLTWTDPTPARTGLTVESSVETTAEVGFRVERTALAPGGGAEVEWTTVATALANSEQYVDATTIPGTSYRYRLVAFSASGDSPATPTSDVSPTGAEFDSVVVTPSAGPNGTISPATPVGVPVGDPQNVTFTMTPDEGYHVADVTVDDVSVGAVTSHTINNVDANHDIKVTFAVNEYPITANAGPNGQIVWATEQNPVDPPLNPAPVQHDVMLRTYQFLPDPGFKVADVLVDGVSLGLPAPTYYTFKNVLDGPHEIEVLFEPAVYTITPSASTGGTISPNTPQIVEHGLDSPMFTMTPDPGWTLADLKIDGVSAPLTDTYTFTNVMADHTIEAVFAQKVRYEQPDARFDYTGTWNTWANAVLSGGSYAYANGADVSTTISFEGTRAWLLARTGPEFGIARVSVDGGAPVSVDLYSPTTMYQQMVFETPPLVAGLHYLYVEWTGTKNVNSAGTNIDVDAIDVAFAAPPAIVGATRVEQSDPLVALGGTWTTWNNAALSGGSYAYSNTAGTKATVVFNGSRLDLVTRTGPEFGIARVTLDGGVPRYVDLYSPTTMYQRTVYSTWPMAMGVHTLTVEWTGRKNAASAGTYIDTDAFDLVGYALQAPGRYEQTDSRIALSGTWNTWSNFALSGGSYAYANSVDASASVAFDGTEITLIGRTGPEFGMATVTLDGGTPQYVDLFSPTQLYQQPIFSASGLAAGPHLVKLSWTGTKNTGSSGTWINIDAVETDGALLQAPARFEQSDSHISLAGAWSTWANAVFSGGSYAYANASGASALVRFTGTRFEWVARTGPEFGIASVSIDGGAPVDVDLYSATTAYKQLAFTAPALTEGPHLVLIAWTGTKNAAATGTYINIDAADVAGGGF